MYKGYDSNTSLIEKEKICGKWLSSSLGEGKGTQAFVLSSGAVGGD